MRVHEPQDARKMGHSPQPPPTPAAAQLATPSPTSACTSPGRAELLPAKPPRPKKTGRGKNPTHLRAENNRIAHSIRRAHTREPRGKKERGRDVHTTAKMRTHSTEAGNPRARQHQRRHPQDQLIGHRKTTPPSWKTPSQKKRSTKTEQPLKGRRKDTPETPAQTPAVAEAGHRPRRRGQSIWQKKTKRRGEGGRAPRAPRPERATATTTEPQHDRADDYTDRPPPAAVKGRE